MLLHSLLVPSPSLPQSEPDNYNRKCNTATPTNLYHVLITQSQLSALHISCSMCRATDSLDYWATSSILSCRPLHLLQSSSRAAFIASGQPNYFLDHSSLLLLTQFITIFHQVLSMVSRMFHVNTYCICNKGVHIKRRFD